MTENSTLDYYLKVLGVTRGTPFKKIKKEFVRQFSEDDLHNTKDSKKQERARKLIEAFQYLKANYDELNTSSEFESKIYPSDYYEKALEVSIPLLRLKYNVYTTLNPKENISFVGWLNQEVKIRALCQELGKPKEVLNKDYKHYKSVYKNSTSLSFVEWLEAELRIINICKSIGKTKDELVTIYLSELMNLRIPNITFEVWLLSQKFNSQDKGYQKTK
jgi:hypothetical protein